MKAPSKLSAAVLRMASACVLVLGGAGCSTQTLGSVAAAMAVNTSSERAEERAELQALAEKSANAEKAPQLETEAAYLQVVAQLQSKQLWFASLAHLDVVDARWTPSQTSQLLRADALRQMGLSAESTVIYQKLASGARAGKALHGLGLLAAQAQQFEQAVQYLSAARERAPTDAVLLSDLGYALLHTGNSMAARVPLMQAAQLQSANTRIQSNVAVFLVLHGKAQEAAAWMDQHQMTEVLRAQVHQQASQLAGIAAVQTSAKDPSFSLEKIPKQLPPSETSQGALHTASVSHVPSPWMTETRNLGARP